MPREFIYLFKILSNGLCGRVQGEQKIDMRSINPFCILQ